MPFFTDSDPEILGRLDRIDKALATLLKSNRRIEKETRLMSIDLLHVADVVNHAADVETGATVTLNNVVAMLSDLKKSVPDAATQAAVQSAMDRINKATPALAAAIANVPTDPARRVPPVVIPPVTAVAA